MVVKEPLEQRLRYTIVAARRSEPRGSMVGVWRFVVSVDLCHLPTTFENSAEIYSHWKCGVRLLNWPWRTGKNTEVVGRNTLRTG